MDIDMGVKNFTKNKNNQHITTVTIANKNNKK